MSELLIRLFAEVAEAAREVPIAMQPPRLQKALAALAVAENRVVLSLLEDLD